MFEEAFFAKQLRREVERVAKKRYGGDESKAFAFWVIRHLSTELTDDEVHIARGICEEGGPGDAGIDGCWLEGSKGPLFLLQAKWDEGMGRKVEETLDEDNEIEDTEVQVKLKNFGKRPAQELWSGFKKVLARRQGQDIGKVGSVKLLQVVQLYKRAVEENRQVKLIVAFPGKYATQLRGEVDGYNRSLRTQNLDRHHVKILDFHRMSSLYSERKEEPPGRVHIPAVAVMSVPGAPHAKSSEYALSLAVKGDDLVKVREENGLNIYHSNFRFVLKNSKIRERMFKTLGDPPERRNFWRYNNGITVVCEELTKGPRGVEVQGLQVVNGLQTMEALHDFAKSHGGNSKLKDVLLHVRVIPTGKEDDGHGEPTLEERIAEYSNSQHPILPRDLRSNDRVQKELDVALEDLGYRYGRKRGMHRKAWDVIDNVNASQRAFAFWRLRPKDAKNSKRLLFVYKRDGGFYEDIFVAGKTTAVWLLTPHLLFRNYERWKKSLEYTELMDYGNLLTLSVLGRSFADIFPYQAPGRVDEKGEKRLSRVVTQLERWLEDDRILRELWSPSFDVVRRVVRGRQRKVSHRVAERPSDRQVAVKLDHRALLKLPDFERRRKELSERVERLLPF